MPAAGYHRITAVLPGDTVPFDDQRALVVRAMDDVRVLLVDGEPGADPRQAETFFLRHALAPVPVEARDAYPVKPVVVPVSGLEAQTLGDFDAIVLANVSDVPLPVGERLARYVEDGGGLYMAGSTFDVHNNHFLANDATVEGGGAKIQTTTADFRNNLVAHTPDGDGLVVQGGTVVSDYNLWFSNEGVMVNWFGLC